MAQSGNPFRSRRGGIKFHIPTYSSPRPKAKRDDDHGLLGDVAGLFGNLGEDIRDAAVGLPTGIAQLVRHPIRSGEQIGKQYWQTYSPLFKGDFKKFGKQVYDHPLGPILDIATVFTAGAGGVAKSGQLAAKVGVVSRESKLAKLGGTPESLTKTVKVPGRPDAYRQRYSNPGIRLRQRATTALGLQLAEHAPRWFGQKVDDATGEVTKGRVRDMSPEGFSDRYHRKQESHRAGAARAAQGMQLAAMVKAGKDITETPHVVARLIEKGGRQSFMDHAFKMKPTDFLDGKQLDAGFTFVAANPTSMGIINSVDDFEKAVKSFGGRHTTTEASKAARTATGEYLVVNKHTAAKWSEEAGRSAKFVRKLYQRPTQVWKYLVLATRPAYFVNNAVGNTFMYTMAFGGAGAARGLVDAYRQVHGEAHTAKSLKGAQREIKKLSGDWQDKWYLGTHQGFAQDVMGDLTIKGKNLPDRMTKVVNVAGQGLYPITHKVSDVFLRRAAINSILRKHPMVKRLQREKGWSFDRAAEYVSSRDPAVRHRVQEQVNDALGDYHHLNPIEQSVRQLIPFYTWDRAIVRHGVKLGLNKPGRTAALVQVGTQGTERTEQLLGKIPRFLKGAMVLGEDGGKARILQTQGMNPYASFPDVVESATQLVGGNPKRAASTLGSQIGPIPASAIEYLTGQDLLSGARIKPRPGGLAGNTAGNIAFDTPIGRLIDTAVKGSPKPKRNAQTGVTTPFLFQKDARAQLLAFVGAPVKELNLSRAHEMARKERGEKKGRRRKYKPFHYSVGR